MTEPQVWAVIGVLSATLVSFMVATITMITRTITVQIGGLRNELGGEIGGLRNEMNAKFETVNVSITGLRNEMNVRMDGLDRDVQALTNRVFGAGTGQ